jgi:OPA family glycerol-3-phosphate transporter-like MFS transporter
MKQSQGTSKKLNKTTLLIALCWLVYTCSYLGKLGYNANITQIESVFSVSHSTAGIVSTFFFFAYGIGQVINGIFCKKYNLKIMVFIALIISGLMNILVGFCNNFTLIKYCWLINGGVLAILYPSLVRVLSENLDKKDLAKSVIAMGTTVATGTFLVYALSALFVAVSSYVITFVLAGILLPLIAIIWLISYPKLIQEKVEISQEIEQENKVKQSSKIGVLWIPIIVLALFAIVDNFVKDGLTTWVPMILKEMYSLPDYVSILLTIVLPILAIFGTSVAVFINKKVKDFVMLSTLLLLGSAIFIGVVILCLPTGLFAVTVISFGIVSCLMAGVNNVITSMAPLYWKDKVNAGLLAGVLNGFCYLGSTISAYGLGAVADAGGWNVVFWLLFAILVVAVIIGLVSFIIKKLKWL